MIGIIFQPFNKITFIIYLIRFYVASHTFKIKFGLQCNMSVP